MCEWHAAMMHVCVTRFATLVCDTRLWHAFVTGCIPFVTRTASVVQQRQFAVSVAVTEYIPLHRGVLAVPRGWQHRKQRVCLQGYAQGEWGLPDHVALGARSGCAFRWMSNGCFRIKAFARQRLVFLCIHGAVSMVGNETGWCFALNCGYFYSKSILICTIETEKGSLWRSLASLTLKASYTMTFGLRFSFQQLSKTQPVVASVMTPSEKEDHKHLSDRRW